MSRKRNLIKQAKQTIERERLTAPPTPEEMELILEYGRKYHELCELENAEEEEILDSRMEVSETTPEDMKKSLEQEENFSLKFLELDRELAKKWDEIHSRSYSAPHIVGGKGNGKKTDRRVLVDPDI